MNESQPVVNRSKIRLGLGLLGIVLIGAIVLFFVIDDRLGKAVFFGVAAVLVVRMLLLVRWLRAQGSSNDRTPKAED